MSCEQCNHFLSFAGNQGINEVTVDGMCMLAGKDKPSIWTPQNKTDTCNYGTGPKVMAMRPPIEVRPQPLKINPNVEQILVNAKADIAKKQVKGICAGCAQWHQKDSPDMGTCWNPASRSQHCATRAGDTCDDFYAKPVQPKPNQIGVGERVEILVGEQWTIRYIGTKQLVCADKTGDEHTFDLKGLRFKKC